MQPEQGPVPTGGKRLAPAALLVAIVASMWLVGGAHIWRVEVREVATFGLEQTPPGTVGDPGWLVTALFTIPFAMVVGWTLRRSRSRWPVAIVATIPAVAMAVWFSVLFMAGRFAGDDSPVETFEIEFAWLMFGCTASLHAVTVGVATIPVRVWAGLICHRSDVRN
ncbi:hypothetical protein ACOACQ_04975 [Nocardioides sp. CPCC 206347]|uniref:hypothetical protein n=2 Tax=Nocardioides TaxID=1839 RepID=UPI003B4391F2